MQREKLLGGLGLASWTNLFRSFDQFFAHLGFIGVKEVVKFGCRRHVPVARITHAVG